MCTLNCAVLGYYAASGGNLLPTFLENLSIGCPKTPVRNYCYLLHNNPQERSSQLLHGGNLQSHTHYVYWLLLSPMLSDLFYSTTEVSGFSEYQLLD